MYVIFAIAVGGAVGAVLRHLFVLLVNRMVTVSAASSDLSKSSNLNANVDSILLGMPWGILVVNMVGSFVLGGFYVWFQQLTGISETLKLGLTVGLLGALTTFSTFAVDTVNFLMVGDWLRAVSNVLLNVIVCCLAVWLAFVAFKTN